MEVATVDLSCSELEVATQLQRASSELGLFYLKGHGLADSFLESVLAASRELFSEDTIPKSERKAVQRQGGGFLRGYIPKGGESGSSMSGEDSKEGFAYGFEWGSGTIALESSRSSVQEVFNSSPPEGQSGGDSTKDPSASSEGVHVLSRDSVSGGDMLSGAERTSEESNLGVKIQEEHNPEFPSAGRNPLEGPNAWPKGFPSQHKHTLQRFFRECCSLARKLLFLLAVHLDSANAEELCSGLTDEQAMVLKGVCGSEGGGGDRISLMRVFRYTAGHKGSVGSSPHTDWGLWTLILQDSHVSGLQVWHNSEWHWVPPLAGSLVVNVGDFLHLITGQKYKSPLHRVVAQTDEERVSLVFFQYPEYNTQLSIGQGETKYSLSLFNFQGASSNRGDQESFKAHSKNEGYSLSFGDTILNKWAQVQRSHTSY